MRVIRPQAFARLARRRSSLLALSMLATGVLGAQLTLIAAPAPTAAGVLGTAAALAFGIGAAWLVRVLRPNRTRDLTAALVDVLGSTFDDSYTLLVAPRLPVRDAARLDGVLVGPAGVRVLTARDWHGRYRVRGRVWEFDARRRGWIRCRTNPGFDVDALVTGFARWAEGRGFRDLPVRGAIVFPQGQSRVILEEPEHEVVTGDNAPWWANTIGRVRRLDDARAAAIVAAVLEAAEEQAAAARVPAASRG